MSNRSFVSVAANNVVLRDAPINPAWVRAGAPIARLGEVARSADGTSVTVVWDCTAGLFDWHFGVDETVHVIEGEVAVTGADGVEQILRPGDIGFFPSGSVSRWRVDTYVRKLAVCRHAMPMPLGFALRAFNTMVARMPTLRRASAVGGGN